MQDRFVIGGGVLLLHLLLAQRLLVGDVAPPAVLAEVSFETRWVSPPRPNAPPEPQRATPATPVAASPAVRAVAPSAEPTPAPREATALAPAPADAGVATAVVAAAAPAPAVSPLPVVPSPGAAPRTVSVREVQYLRAPAPVYPRAAERRGESGEVVLKVLIGTDGHPAQVLLSRSSGFDALDRAAIDAMRAAVFKPYAENGVPQTVWVHTPIAFDLESAS